MGTVNQKHASKFQTMYSQSLLMEQKIVILLFHTIVSWRKTAIVDFPVPEITCPIEKIHKWNKPCLVFSSSKFIFSLVCHYKLNSISKI
jgi:hypothetical protein